MAFGFALITALLWGASSIIEKLALAKVAPVQAIVVRSLGITLVFFLIMLVSRQTGSLRSVPLHTILMVITAGLMAGGIGQWTYYMALKHGRASMVVPVAASFPLVTFALATILLREPVTVPRVIGVLLIIAGVVLVR
ncbi:MAG: EamA family transporter [bacterium]|nr:EamA family transporter [bacterium]